jgi:hypothetical protein
MARQQWASPAPDPEWQADKNGELLRQHGLCGHQGCTHKLKDAFWIAWAEEYRKQPGFSATACSRRCIWNWWYAYRDAVRKGWWGPKRPLVKKIKPESRWTWGRRGAQPREPQRAQQPQQQPEPGYATCRCQGGTLPCSSGICPRRPQYKQGQKVGMAGAVRITQRGPEQGPPAEGIARPRSVALNPSYEKPGTDVELSRYRKGK